MSDQRHYYTSDGSYAGSYAGPDADIVIPAIVEPEVVDPAPGEVLEQARTVRSARTIPAHNPFAGLAFTLDPPPGAGAVFRDGAWQAAPRYPDLAAAMAALQTYIASFVATFTGGIPEAERAAWPSKERAAEAWLAAFAAGTDPTPADAALIEPEADLRGIAADALCRTILAKAETYRRAIALVSGLRATTVAALEAASDPAEFETILEAAEARAEELMAGLESPAT